MYVFKSFLVTKWFSQKKIYGSFGIGLFVSSDTYKGKAAYIRISPDPMQAGSHCEVVLLLLYKLGLVRSNTRLIGHQKANHNPSHPKLLLINKNSWKPKLNPKLLRKVNKHELEKKT